MIYRHELKYYIHNFDVETLKLQLKQVMDVDHHQGIEGYNVSSLYFDTLYNRFYDENAAGANIRKKIRIRKYNNDNSNLKIEIKAKKDDLCYKESSNISLVTASKFIKLPYEDISDYSNSVLSKVLLMNRLHSIKPVVMVDYNRFALVHNTGNVRITFDTNIKGDVLCDNFLSDVRNGVNIIDDDHSILEVKYDDILPSYIANILDKYNLNQIAYSKYYLCRNTLGI